MKRGLGKVSRVSVPGETGADEESVSSLSQACNLSPSDVIIVFSADYYNVNLTWFAVRICAQAPESAGHSHVPLYLLGLEGTEIKVQP